MTTFALVPGAGGDAWYWHRVVPELERRGHPAVPVDLPADDDAAGLAAYAETVVAAIGDRSPVVLVAQSMGGYTAPLVCERVPVALLVLVNAMVPRPGETGGEWWAATGHPDPGDVDAAIFAGVPPEVVDELTTRPFWQSERPFADPWPLPRWPAVATRVVAGRDDRFFPLDFQRRVARGRLGLDVDEVPGGHLVALSHPAELADRLVSYVRAAEPVR